MNEPIKVKAYGFLPITKQAYIIMQVLVFGAGVPLLTAYTALRYYLADTPGGKSLWLWVGIVVVISVVGEIVETILMLRKFRQKEQRSAHLTN